MLPDRVSNPGPLTYKSGALQTALQGPGLLKFVRIMTNKYLKYIRNFAPNSLTKFMKLTVYPCCFIYTSNQLVVFVSVEGNVCVCGGGGGLKGK